MKKIIVLGAGMVGSTIAADLSLSFKTTVADISTGRLDKLPASIEKIKTDLAAKNILQETIKDYDLVIGALPGFLGFETLRNVIGAGKNVIDISFFNEDPFELDSLARSKNVTAVVDCGVAPGMSNIILGYHSSGMNIEEFRCTVGGLPFVRTWPFEYKAPFSPADVIEEYTRPARFVENSIIKIREALSDPEYIHVDEVGTLEAFNTDGLRSLLKTMKIPNMIEKTLRYPKHIEYIRVLKAAGFFSSIPVDVKGVPVRPVDLSAKLLFPLWHLHENEEEFTVMIISIRGTEGGYKKEYVYKMFDRYDEKTGFSSMARTTGFTCSAAAHLVLNGKFETKGISPPEYLGMDRECFKFILGYLKERNVIYNVNGGTY